MLLNKIICPHTIASLQTFTGLIYLCLLGYSTAPMAALMITNRVFGVFGLFIKVRQLAAVYSKRLLSMFHVEYHL